MPNRLAGEKSPYLLQHAGNPVDWYPWGDEAFEKARREDKPVFLSIGYSTCHWCHVMEDESFEDHEVAALLNRHFVSIKVDREERPDIDQVYMTVCQATTGAGGWPLTVFMGPDKRPFFAGTYFPKTARFGSPGLMDVARSIADLWKNQRGRLDGISEEITNAIQPKPPEETGHALGRDILSRAHEQLRQTFDPVWGGFGSAPKFPTPHNAGFLLRWQKRDPASGAVEMVEKNLQQMRAGGIFDQIGFGFHRYSVDQKWLVPHFEKMLYDQALLAPVYLDAFLVTGNRGYARVAEEIFEYVLRDMKSPEGAFFSAEDADSEGREGLFYTWNPRQISEVLGKDAGELFCRAFDISPEGNFEDGLSIPHFPKPFEELAPELGMSVSGLEASLEESRRKLFAAREKRVHPLKDDKILLAWNGLMISALARGAQVLGDPSYAENARTAADFLLSTMRQSGRLSRRYRQGEVAHPACADDYAFLIWGLLDLYEAVFDLKYLSEAVGLQEEMLRNFWDVQNGGFEFTGKDSEEMIAKEKIIYDGATPSSNSVSALNLLRLGRMTGNTAWEDRADRLMKFFSGQVSLLPPAYTHFLQAVDFALGPTREIVIAGDPASGPVREMIATVNRPYMPNRVVMLKAKGAAGDELSRLAPFTAEIPAGEVGAAVYVCENFSCRKPVTNPAELESIFQE